MPKNRTKKSSRTALPLTSLSDALRRHIRKDLRLETIEEYLAWCRQHGFRPHLQKTPLKLEEEARYLREEQVRASVARARTQHRPERVLSRILAGDCKNLPPEMVGICQAIHGNGHGGGWRTATRRDFAAQLIGHLNRRCPRFLWRRAGTTTVLDAVLAMVPYHRDVVRPVEDWRPRAKNPERNVASLARHLFAEWDVPSFLDECWYDRTSPYSAPAQKWFLHIGRGQSVRTAGLPVRFTKKMAHHFLQAPNSYSPAAAVRWGQVHGLGGDPRLCNALLGTRLCEGFEHEDFWSTVLAFFARHPMLDVAHVGPIIDYLHHQRFVSDRFVDADGSVQGCPPPQPNLSMRGRSVESLLRQVESWHYQLGRVPATDKDVSWKPSDILPFQSTEGQAATNQRTFVIRELCSAADLQYEGRKMNHCVATYTSSCRAGRTSIWTMEMHGPEGRKKLATIEVRNAVRRIVQVKAKSNRSPSAQARTLLSRWANGTNLTLASWV